MAFDKLSRLAPQLFGEKPSDLASAMQSAEKLISLSGSYRELLMNFGGAIWFDNGARYRPESPNPLTKKDGYNNLEFLYGLGNGKNSIERKAEQYAGELPASFVPIGEAPGGNLICMDGDGAVYLWDHESQRKKGTWRIATSVEEFLRKLEPDDSEIGNTDGIIESESFLDF